MARDQHRAGGWGGATAASEAWFQFDGLPRGLKRVYWEAPYLYTAMPAVEMYVYDEMDPRAVAEILLWGQAQDVAREAMRLYGPSHPQAGEPA